MQRWNEQTKRYEPFSPGSRNFQPLPAKLRAQLEHISPTDDGTMKYYPCAVILRDGRWQDFVYVVDADAYIRVWGVWPDQDSGKREIKIEDVEAVQESPSRLPVAMAQRLYKAGESGMGYVLFELSYTDGSRSGHISGNAVDFVHLPEGKSTDEIAEIHPHASRGAAHQIAAPKYYWCLFTGA